RFVIASADRDHIAETTQGGSFTDEDLANARHIATFDPPTVLALLDEIERLRWERETLAAAVMGWQRYLERDVGTEIVHVRTLEAHGRALALLDGEEGGVGE